MEDNVFPLKQDVPMLNSKANIQAMKMEDMENRLGHNLRFPRALLTRMQNY